jgi:hypothetical protein
MCRVDSEGRMEYRGKYYLVFRSPTSSIWMWSVDLDAHTVAGGPSASQEAGIKSAERLIDKALAQKKQKLRKPAQ